MPPKQQLNVSISAAVSDRIRLRAQQEGRKIGDIVERMGLMYDGDPTQILQCLKRLTKDKVRPDHRGALREAADYIAFLLMPENYPETY